VGIVCKLEDDLIHPNKWKSFYGEMPKECKEVVDSPPECIGIGKNDKLGWFIMGSGQGPCLCWAENDKRMERC